MKHTFKLGFWGNWPARSNERGSMNIQRVLSVCMIVIGVGFFVVGAVGLEPQGTLPTVTIGWEPPQPTTPVWYNLYKTTSNPSTNPSPCNGGTWTKVNTDRIGFFMPQMEYTDNNASRGLSWYAVTAQDENGESDCSDIVAVNIPLARPGRPRNPKLNGITP